LQLVLTYAAMLALLFRRFPDAFPPFSCGICGLFLACSRSISQLLTCSIDSMKMQFLGLHSFAAAANHTKYFQKYDWWNPKNRSNNLIKNKCYKLDIHMIALFRKP